MSTTLISPAEKRGEFPFVPDDPARPLPDHTQLPDSDGEIVTNFQEHPQGSLLTDPIEPYLRQLRPDLDFCIGQDNGIYWKLTEPYLRGAVSPDWFLIFGVPLTLEGKMRRSYVLWKEHVPPSIVLEIVSGNGREERDETPEKGKFWIYEQAIGAEYYGIFEGDPGRIEMYRLVNGMYELQEPNAAGRYPIDALGLELGIWRGRYWYFDLSWMRWWYPDGTMIPTGQELADMERERADEAQLRADRLEAQLRALGIDPNA